MDLGTASGFDWDDGNRHKCQKHGVLLAEIEAVFAGPQAYLPDALHSRDEDRFIAVGSAGFTRPVFVVFTLRLGADGLLVRPISARYMHRAEVDSYVEALSQLRER